MTYFDLNINVFSKLFFKLHISAQKTCGCFFTLILLVENVKIQLILVKKLLYRYNNKHCLLMYASWQSYVRNHSIWCLIIRRSHN